jgi:disulfide bond formation protein DsbB
VEQAWVDRFLEDTPAFGPLGVAGLAAALLLGAFGFQYIGGLAPCELCLWQRWPHAVLIGTGLGAFLLLRRSDLGLAAAVMGLAAIVALVSVGLGVMHVGVEQHWWKGPTSCAASGITDLSQLALAPVVRCDAIAWQMFGISMAGYNALISLALAAFAWVSAKALRRAHRANPLVR